VVYDASTVSEQRDAKVATADPDGAILERFRSGDRAAFDELVRKYEAPIRALAKRYVKVEEDAKDVAQRIFVRAFERFSTFKAQSQFRTWLYRIAVNLALDHVRGGHEHDTLPIEDDVAFTSSLGTAKLVAAEVWKKVSARLADLPPRQRLVVELRVFHDLSFEEVAAIVGSSEDAAKMNYHHGVKRLRALLPAQG
jgi:RNA polymerase sigma-70 factor (ECF subfamily)